MNDVWECLICSKLIGKYLYVQENKYMKAIRVATQATLLRNRLPWLFKLGSLVPIPALRRFFGADGLVRDYGDLALRKMKARTPVDDNPDPFGPILRYLLWATSQSDQRDLVTENTIPAEVANISIHGTDCVAAMLERLIQVILESPGLRRQVEAEVAQFRTGFDKDTPLLDRIINETFRLHPTGPPAMRSIILTDEFKLCGHWIPRGTIVGTQPYTVHRDASLFDNPLEYAPNHILYLFVQTESLTPVNPIVQ